MKNEKTEKEAKRGEKSSTKRLLLANAAALLVLLAVTVAVLCWLGLFDSVWASFFPKR